MEGLWRLYYRLFRFYTLEIYSGGGVSPQSSVCISDLHRVGISGSACRVCLAAACSTQRRFRISSHVSICEDGVFSRD